LDRDMDDIAYRDGEQITYQRRGRTWIAVSGYWGYQIFYRKSNLACGGSVARAHAEACAYAGANRRVNPFLVFCFNGFQRMLV
jgi:hypothetical protein